MLVHREASECLGKPVAPRGFDGDVQEILVDMQDGQLPRYALKIGRRDGFSRYAWVRDVDVIVQDMEETA